MEFKDKLVSINRITKVVKGGRRFTFAALSCLWVITQDQLVLVMQKQNKYQMQ